MPFPHFWLLLLWIVVGAYFRFVDLGTLPPWTDESATVVFSLGNSFYDVPLNEFISLPTLMEPLQLNTSAGITDVIDLLRTESTHPPLYFVLTHLWLKLFPALDGLVSIEAARSLSALFGVMAIPAMFYFTKLAFSSLSIAQIAAAMMAISPFGIFLATQARHYTLVILLIIASLACFISAFRSVNRHLTIPLKLVVVWITINCLGVATHYFFVLTLASIAIVFTPLLWQHGRQDKTLLLKPQWQRIYLVAIGSLMGCLVWLPSLIADRHSSPTEWIYASNAASRWLEPIGRFLLWLMSTVILLPSSIYDFPLSIIITAGIITLIFWVWHLPPLIHGLKSQRQTDTRETITALLRYLIAAIAIFAVCTYILGMDLTLAGRFQFVYFPVVIVLIAAALGYFWEQGNSLTSNESQSKQYSWFNLKNYYGKKIVIVMLLIGFLGGIVANLNRGYLQNHRPDLAINKIVEGTKAPVAIATTYKHHGQTGRIIGLAWGLKNFPNTNSPQFFLAKEDSSAILAEKLTRLERPLDLWLVNFRGEMALETQNCFPDSNYKDMVGQYKYKLYRCQ